MLAQKDGVVFVLNFGLDNAYTGAQGDEFQAMSAQIREIVDIFKIK